MVSLYDADIIIAEVEAPITRWCDCGHSAQLAFKLSPTAPEHPVRFFMVTHKETGVKGIYCEPCLIIANHLAKKQKAGSTLKE